MVFGTIFLIILYLLFRYIIAWITYYNNLDARLGDSTWRFTYDYPVVGERDVSDLDDKNFVRLRRKKNKVILMMYAIVLIMFIVSMGVLSKFLIFFTFCIPRFWFCIPSKKTSSFRSLFSKPLLISHQI